MSGEARDAALTVGLVLTFAAFVTAHAAIVFGLAGRRRFAEALGALIVPPLGPVWAFTRGMRLRACLWLASAALYGAAFVLTR